MPNILAKIFGDQNEKEVKRLQKTVEAIEAFEPQIKALSDGELRAKTDEFKQRLKQGETLDDILPEAFAVVREASVRTLGMRHFPVQLLGGIVLHQGRIAEMKTGEGKTLVATLPAYLNALTGEGVHIVTVNDYLARRDREWMGKIYEFLGLKVGLIQHDMDSAARQEAYAADITYGTNNEFGFDYLRDNMVIYKENMVQRGLNYAIVDEVDSILIDEARTPLIISGAGQKSTELYYKADKFALRLAKDIDYEVDEKAKTISLTEEGSRKAERFFNVDNITDMENTELLHNIIQAIKAHVLMRRDVDYVVKDNEVIIVDEFTGRLMFGRRYSDGLHQAIEAKEGVRVQRESRTLATITFQNYFRMYKKLAGMTGTAKTEEEEFQSIYGLDVVVIPTNMPMIRKDYPDVIYRTEEAKFKAVTEEIAQRHAKGQPVLVGTISIEKSEKLSRMLEQRGIPHQVLNAKYHEKEAEIIAKAGQPGAVTIATNMAGRGTDIVLGEGIAQKGGLHVMGTERHESRRIDNQLRGRSGRQGDPGSSRFYLSLEDDLLRLFGSDRIMNLVDALGMDDDTPIENNMLTKQIEAAQKRVEAKNFDIRKQLLEYDNVLNVQREVIYKQRRQVLEGENLKDSILDMIKSLVEEAVKLYTSNSPHPEEWDIEGLAEHLGHLFLPAGALTISQEDKENLTREEFTERLVDMAYELYDKREKEIGEETMRELERVVMLKVVDQKWMDHLDDMDRLRDGIGLRAYGQRDPLVEYKIEGYDMFQEMIHSIQEDTVTLLYHVKVEKPPEREQVAKPALASHGGEGSKPQTVKRAGKKIGRNDPCPCGSGKKYKECCGRIA
ncbi:preprotein translocase subunit SecA [Mahella australiensis]|uniref:Protein translocase subunit SecA n=1 Tax=Mahella australiensis (strain DSM 15567 / CIP 107919 / 50-1 BON) TaxID=697281 RepID=F3ZYM5_MAHA5|nr:preprotein translocase subunit SecA [Mahella australiensis]AEE97793.1 protein translocase subunit secA [Mahella australiensis 50-1 BON]